MNTRLKKLREYLGMTQKQFSESIGISRPNLTNIETGKVSLTERTIKTICSVHNVSEDWLRNGSNNEEPIFNDLSEDEEFDMLVGRLYADNDPFKKKVIKTMLTLEDEDWHFIEKFINRIKKD
ncbi:helix-turn-helix domain-containing protein [Paraclostridium sordellii]|uniref:helix-turn-helix domain-containing protein n=1 Tax=Paraclostridium sordellii TaxID=1505 RepID=UPI0022E4C4E1|nr:helix-turn-helix domain-containing protein [Paeniclostridium sordellii]